MNDPSELESMLRSLRPNSLPEDVRQRLAEPPPCQTAPRRVLRPVLAGLAVLAAAAAVAIIANPPQSISPPPADPVSIHHRESTLIDLNVLGYVEHGGRVWRLEDRQWKDEEQAFCSNSPVSVSLSRKHHELSYHPVSFD